MFPATGQEQCYFAKANDKASTKRVDRATSISLRRFTFIRFKAELTKEELTKIVTKRALESLRQHFGKFAAKNNDPIVPGLHEQINTMSDLERFIT